MEGKCDKITKVGNSNGKQNNESNELGVKGRAQSREQKDSVKFNKG